MDAYPSHNKKQNSLMQFLKPVGWAVMTIVGVLVASWVFRTLLPGIQPGANPTVTPEVSFETNVRQGNLCAAPLAVLHNFGVYLSSPDKSQFVAVDSGNTIGEMRSFTWSTDGKQLFILGNTTGSGNIYIADAANGQAVQLLATGELDYMMDASWSRDEKQIVIWSARNNKVLYLVNVAGARLTTKQLNAQILGMPQFWPDGNSVVFLGAISESVGLFELRLGDSEAALINSSIESASSYAVSPDGSSLAYMEYDRETGEARLWLEDLLTHESDLLGTFPIPKGSGSSVPATANMIWSVDGKSIVFDVGRGANDRVIYLAHVDDMKLIKIVDSGYAPAISGDGKCLAYISGKQIFLRDLTDRSNTAVSIMLADLPSGRGGPNYQLDKLQWRPEP